MSRGGNSLGDMTMGFGGDDSGFQRVADRVERRAKDMASGSAANGLLNIGRIYLVNTIGEGLRRMGNAAAEMSQKIRLGEAAMGDLVEKVAEGIPYIGHFVEAGRGIRELITGDNAYVEVLKRQTAEQEKRIEVMNDYIAAIRRMQRAREDATTRANFNAGDSPLAFLFGQTVTGGERASEDARAKLKAENEKLLKELDDQKQQIAEKIRQRKEALSGDLGAPVVTASGTAIPVQSRIAGNDSVLADLEKNAKLIEDKASRIRQGITDTNNATEQLIGRQVFTRVASLVGEKFVGAFDSAVASIGRYLGRLPEATNATAKLAAALESLQQARSANIGQFVTEQQGLGIDRARGLLSPDLFRRLTDKSFADQIARTAQSVFQQYAPIVEMIARITDANVGGPFRKIFGALGQVGDLLPGRVAGEAKPFQSRFVGLEELGKNIQQAAAGGAAKKDPVQDGILQAAQRTAKATEDSVDLLRTVGTVK